MSNLFEEIDYRPTSMGALSLRRRRDLARDIDVYEIKLGGEFLMSSSFTASETALARLALAALPQEHLDILIGGLGLGYTAKATLGDARVDTLTVIEMMPEVIEWHRKGLVPLGNELSSDPRCTFVQGDFFALTNVRPMATAQALPRRAYHAVLVDIDHSPRVHLHPDHASFYRPERLSRLADLLQPKGIFALWSNEPPDPDFLAALEKCFDAARAEVVSFPNPLQERGATSTIYVAQKAV